MKKLKNEIVQWIKDWFLANGDENTPAVIGISGGKDSSVVAALCVEALGSERVLGVLMPCGEQADIADAHNLVEHLGVSSVKINIGPMYDISLIALEDSLGTITNSLVKGNLQARLRMSTLYAVSQERGGRVSNNCNASERYVGYSTLYGDDTGDFAPLANLTMNEVMKLGEQLGLPETLWNKTPVDGLANNVHDGEVLTDEDAMGFTYNQLEEYMSIGSVTHEPGVSELIEEKHNQSKFKRERQSIPSYVKGF